MKLILLLFTIIIFFISCTDECTGKQVTCPAFNDNIFLQWMPYSKNDQLIFTSTAGSDTFHIRETYLSASFSDTVTGRNPYCSADASFTSNFSNNAEFSIYCRIDHDQFANNVKKSSTIYLKGSSFYGDGFADTGFVTSQGNTAFSHFYPTYSLVGKTFQNVQENYIDTVRLNFKSNQVYKFWVAKNIGIVAYEEYHGNLWVKQ